jgi:outer membrane protein assembly factor BamD
MVRLLILAALFVCAPAHAEKKKRARLSVQEQYELGLKYMKRGMYIKALEQFNRVRNYHRDDPHSVKAELAIGDVYFKKAEWDQARLSYEDFSRMHPRHSDLDYVIYQIGMANYKKAPKAAGRDQTFTRHALTSWTGFNSRFPESTYIAEVEGLASECRDRLAVKEVFIARFYKRRASWGAVERRAANMLSRYPDSEFTGASIELIGEASAWQGNNKEADMAVKRLEADDPKAAEKLAAKLERIKVKAAKPGR